MASTSTWIPPPGRHTVHIGSSLGRAIKNRKLKGSPAPTTKRSNLPERDFYSFKFNFKASSIDASKPATIDIKKGTENTQIRAEYPSAQPGEVHTFNGIEQPARDVDCILIFDEDTGQYTLEKLESYVQLKFDRKMMVPQRPTSPAPTPTGKGKAKQEDYKTASVVEDNASGGADVDDLEALLQQAIAEEPEEGEEIELPLKLASESKPQPPSRPANVRPVKPLPKARADPPAKAQPSPPPPPKAKPAPKTKKKVQPPVQPPPTTYPDEEVIEFGKPAKRPRPSPPRQLPPPPPRAASPVSLSLPGGSTPAFAPPPAPTIPKPTISRNVPAPVPPPPQPAVMPPSPQMIQDDSDDDSEDWEQVPTVAPVIPQAAADYEAELEEDIFGDGFGDDADGGEDIDANDFEKMMNEQMERADSEDESEMVAVSPEPPDLTRQPISLKELASGGAGMDSDDDDFSSSDESDED